MKPEGQSYESYYEDKIRTMRAINPKLEREVALAMVLVYAMEACDEEGDSDEERKHYLETCERRFNEAWNKTEATTLTN